MTRRRTGSGTVARLARARRSSSPALKLVSGGPERGDDDVGGPGLLARIINPGEQIVDLAKRTRAGFFVWAPRFLMGLSIEQVFYSHFQNFGYGVKCRRPQIVGIALFQPVIER